MFLAKLPHWAFVGWVGLITAISVIGQQFFDLTAVIGWGVLTLTTLCFYLLTIEQEHVRCEKAGLILMPGGVLTILATWADGQLVLLIIGLLLVSYAIVLEAAEHNPKLHQKIYRKAKVVETPIES
jgi:hypothetical protein